MHGRPAKQHVELVEQKSVKKITMTDVRKMSAEQYEAALKDTDLGRQIEALLADQSVQYQLSDNGVSQGPVNRSDLFCCSWHFVFHQMLHHVCRDF